MKMKNSRFGDRLIQSVSQRFEDSRNATAYLNSPGRSFFSFISPTFGVLAQRFLTFSNASRHDSSSAGAIVAGSRSWYLDHPSKVARSSSLNSSLGFIPSSSLFI